MPKQGILHDYDLLANQEESAQGQTCIVCGANPVRYQWSDYSGEGMCTQCGTPYQLKWGSDEQKEGNAYPYLDIKEEWVPIIQAYWNETKKWTYFGTSMSGNPGLDEFHEWAKQHYPEMYEEGA